MYISDGQSLLIILVLLYLTECLIWVKGQSVAFVPRWGHGWRVASHKSWLGNAKGGLLFMNPLSPPGHVFLSHLSPISISPFGICAFNPQTLPSAGKPPGQTNRFLAFSDITASSTEGANLLVNNERFAKCATSRQARAISNLINATAVASDRESIVRSYVAKQFAADEAAADLREAEAAIRPMRWMCSILFLFLFVATPILVSIFGLLRLLVPVAIVMIVLAAQISILFYRAHKKLYAGETSERLENMVKMVLCPPVSIRAADLLTRNLLSEYSPIILAGLLRGSTQQQFVRAFIRDLQHPLKHEVTDETAAEIIRWSAGEQLRMCLKHVGHVSYSTSEGLLAPIQPEGNAISYCPRCGCQFVVRSGECPDCPGVGRVAFSNVSGMDAGGAVSQTNPNG